MKNKQILLASRPPGMPTLDNFSIVDAEVPEPKDGEVLLRTRFLSVDPYMRGRMRDQKSYAPPFALNECIAGVLGAEGIEIRAPAFQPKDTYQGMLFLRLYPSDKAGQITH